MSTNDWVSAALAIVGILIGIAGFLDGRRQRSRHHRSKLIIQRLIGRLNGFLIGIKPTVQNDQVATKAVNDCLDAINQANSALAVSDEP